MKKLSNIINTKAYMEKFKGYHVPNYTQTPNEIFDKFLSHLSHAELRVLLYIVRRTFGFHKEYKGDAISLSQICKGIIKKDKETGETRVFDEGTGLSKKSAILAIKNLEGKGHIIVWRGRITKAGDKDSNWYRLNTTLSFSQEVACSADLQLHAPHWLEANKLHGNRLSHANREDGLCEDILVDKVVLGR